FAVTGQLNQVSVGDNSFGLSDPTKHQPLDSAALARMAALPHVKDAYGNLEIQGTLSGGQSDLSNVYLTSFTPLSETPQALAKFLAAGRFPSADNAGEVLISGDTAVKLGFTPSSAVGHKITFHGQFPGIYLPGSGQQPATDSLALEMTIVGVLSSAGNLGTGGAYFISAPYATATNYWDQMARANHWTADEFSNITLVAETAGS